eukprot:TRINITY_DN2917_c0_g1_i1.p1 TRINITY_DN2917_c0_g1~~TRINITY_DN2917_c0_g1_i1.p1  ORF type:complete len:272 (-),score=6.43 TRINITY_DN2917_c0_g1_i1:113-928(-)
MSSLPELKLCLIVWLCIIVGTHGLIVEKSISTTRYDSPFIEVAKFGFEELGTLNLEISFESREYNNTRTHLFICDQSKYEVFSQVFLWSEQCKNLNSFNRCFYSKNIEDTYVNVSLVIPDKSTYHVLFANCERWALEAKVSLHMKNPGKSHLDTSYDFIVEIFFVNLVLNLFICIFLVGNTFRIGIKRTFLIHHIYTVSILVKALSIIFGLIFWKSLSDTGIVSVGLDALRLGSSSLWKVLQIIVMILVGKGWCITRSKITKEEIKSIAGL